MLESANLLERLLAVPPRERDAWVDALLGLEDVPADVELPRGSVPYLPCSVEAIIAMVREAPLGRDDVLVDLGAGLGRVVMLAHLLSGARSVGIEIQAPLVERARARSRALGLADVSFVHANVVDVELDGSMFFLYAPFNGAMLAAVLRRLEEVARRRPIVVCAVDLEVDVPWLSPRKTSCASLTLYDGKR